jgi:hypothetical protein
MTTSGAIPLASNDAARLASLKAQVRPERVPSPSLVAVLGGSAILPGREHEAWEIWNGLCARAKAGDAGASEDMAALTVLLTARLKGREHIDDAMALSLTALESACLPRHRQEQLGRLVRLAIRKGDSEGALAALSQMQLDSPDIESDSELRVSGALTATLIGDSQSVFALLGARGYDIPLVPQLFPLAVVLRAHAYEQQGDVVTASQLLHALPHQSLLPELREAVPSIALCAKASELYSAIKTSERQAKPAPTEGALIVGPLMLGGAVVMLLLFFGVRDGSTPTGFDLVIYWGLLILLLFLGWLITSIGFDNRRKAAFIKARGTPLIARITAVEGTTARIGSVPIYRLVLEVAGPNGPYRAEAHKALHANEVSAMVGKTLHVLANPDNPTEIMVE